MFTKLRFKWWVNIAFSLLVLLIIISFIDSRHTNKACGRVLINVNNKDGHYFLDENDILQLMTNNGDDYLIGAKYKNINTKKLEVRVKNNKFVKDCQISHNLRGELNVDVVQVEPIARFLVGNKQDFYINEKGRAFEISDKYTARVLLVTNDNPNKRPDFEVDEDDKKLLDLLQTIYRNAVWKAQIAQIHISKEKEITLFTQLGNQQIEFGKLEHIQAKFQKLNILYKKILPYKGWESYKKVNLKYHNQIICE